MGVNGIKRGGTRWQKFRRYGGSWEDSFFETFFGHTFLLLKSFLSLLFLLLVLVAFFFSIAGLPTLKFPLQLVS